MTLTVILFYLHSIERSPISLYNCKATTFELVRAKINMQKLNVSHLIAFSLRTYPRL